MVPRGPRAHRVRAEQQTRRPAGTARRPDSPAPPRSCPCRAHLPAWKVGDSGPSARFTKGTPKGPFQTSSPRMCGRRCRSGCAQGSPLSSTQTPTRHPTRFPGLLSAQRINTASPAQPAFRARRANPERGRGGNWEPKEERSGDASRERPIKGGGVRRPPAREHALCQGP